MREGWRRDAMVGAVRAMGWFEFETVDSACDSGSSMDCLSCRNWNVDCESTILRLCGGSGCESDGMS